MSARSLTHYGKVRTGHWKGTGGAGGPAHTAVAPLLPLHPHWGSDSLAIYHLVFVNVKMKYRRETGASLQGSKAEERRVGGER